MRHISAWNCWSTCLTVLAFLAPSSTESRAQNAVPRIPNPNPTVAAPGNHPASRAVALGRAQDKPPNDLAPDPENADPTEREKGGLLPLLPVSPTIIDPRNMPIDLNTALRLAGVQNPELNLARQRTLEAVALRQLAAAQILPTLNPGTNYDTHTGALQQSNGNILTVNRSAVYVGAGSNAVAAGTVNIPGVMLSGNISDGIFAYLVSRQVVREREFATIAVRNQTFLNVTIAYSELTRAEARRAIAMQAREEARLVARLTADYATQGEGRFADAHRAATELAKRETNFQEADGQILIASARLAQLLNLDPSIRFHPTDAWVVPHQVVPDPIPIAELIAIALLQRPELAERRAAIRESFLALEGAKILPFSPTVLLGYSAGGFGGGSNLVRPVFGAFGYRTDFDAIGYWTIRNLGVGNVALIKLANARLQASRFQELEVLNQVRADVAAAYARTHVRFAQIHTTEQAVITGARAFREDYDRIRLRAERDVLPIELLDSFRLLARARDNLVDAIVDYNESQFQMFVALGQPPANVLAHPVPVGGVIPAGVRPIVPPPNPVQPDPARVPQASAVPMQPPVPRVASVSGGATNLPRPGR
jgi:outer membrane protein TolC